MILITLLQTLAWICFVAIAFPFDILGRLSAIQSFLVDLAPGIYFASSIAILYLSNAPLDSYKMMAAQFCGLITVRAIFRLYHLRRM